MVIPYFGSRDTGGFGPDPAPIRILADIKHEPASEQLVAIVAVLDQVRAFDPPLRCPMASIAPVQHGFTENDYRREDG